MFYFPTRLSEKSSDEPSGALLLHCATHAVQVAQVWRQQRVHLLTAVSQCRFNQDAVQMKKCVEGKSGPFSFPGFEACCFFRFRWARTSFLYAYVQEVGFSTPCTCISKPTFYFYQRTEWYFFCKTEIRHSSICGLLKMHLLPFSFPPQRRQLAGSIALLIPDAGHIF